MLEDRTLDEIGTLLIKGKITLEDSQRMIEKMRGNKAIMSKHPKEKETVILEEDCLKVFQNGHTKAYIQFYEDIDSSNNSFIMLQCVRSYKESKGYFTLLLKKLETLAKKRNNNYLFLEVDYKNERAISVYESLGFYSLGPEETISENIDRILMRKDLLHGK
jgi:hypothetical protein